MMCDLCKHEEASESILCANCAEGIRRLVRISMKLQQAREQERSVEFVRKLAAGAPLH
jgi:NADH:ubiquinone oxidoreductase subunit F (NADH-binding)